MSNTIMDVLAAIFAITIIYILVRPGSAATTFITNFGSALSGIVKTAADLGTNSTAGGGTADGDF